MEYPSKLIEDAVNEISKLPGIGKKTALRLTLHIIKQDMMYATALSDAIANVRKDIKYCKSCHAIADIELCNICSSHKRDKGLVCVVEDIKDVIAIENTNQYNGIYHVLGGVISPLERIGPDELNIQTLVDKASDHKINEVVLALSPTMEGDTTSFYIAKKLKPMNIKVTTIARGIPLGGELEYADEVTLGRSIVTRRNIDF